MAKAKTKKNTWTSWSEDEVKLLKKLFPCEQAREITACSSNIKTKR